jgi:RHS repeat-associated protein
MLGLSKPGAAAQQLGNRGMPPNPTQSEAIRPERPQRKSDREARVARLELNLKDRVTLAVGESAQLVAVPVDTEGHPINGVIAEWESRNSQIAVVTKDGEVTSVAPGIAPVTATVGQRSATLVVTVVPGASASVSQVQNKWGKRSRRPHQQLSRNSSVLFAHGPSSALMASPPPLGVGEAEQLYEPRNAVGAPPGRTTPGATVPGTAIGTTETPGSANFSFKLNVISLPGRNQSLDFDLTYNSRIWTKSLGYPAQMTYNMDAGWIAPGFVAGYGYLDNQSDGTAKQFMITDSSGTRHRMVNVPVGSNTYESNDGTSIKLTVSGTQVTPAVAIFPGGQQLRYAVGDVSIPTRYYPTQVTDRNGNFITIAYAGDSGRGPKIYSIRDTLGRYLCFKYAGNDLIAITAPGLTGERPIMRFYYENISNLNQAGLFQSGIVVNAPSGGTARVIKYIYLPNATEAANAHIGYRYDYSSYGMIYKITQSRGMTISTDATDYTQSGTITNEGTLAAQTTYNYHGTPDNPTTGISDAPFYTTRTDDWAGRTSAQPVYTFSVNQSTGLSTVTAPNGTISETHAIVSTGWDNGLVNQTTMKVGATVWSDAFFSWELSPNNIPRLIQVKATNEAVPAQTKAVVFTYDPLTTYNNISKVSERDFTTNGTVSATELRRTETTYVTDSSYTNRGLISLPSSVKVFPGGSASPISQTDYFYDEFGLASAPGIIMYEDPGNPARGNVTRRRTYPDITNLANYIDHTATYDIAGNTLTAQLDCCQQKSFVYSSAYFYGYLTSVTSGSGPTLTTSATYDLNTGLVGTATDENSQQTSFYYNVDSLRPEHVDYADGGRTSFTYNDALSANASGMHYYSCIDTRLDATNSVQNYSFYDGRGAVTQTFAGWTSVNGWSTQDIEYDVMGRALRVGNPYYSGGYSPSNQINPTQFWTTRTYDNLGRVTILTMPTGDSSPSSTTTVQTNYAGSVTTVTDQAGKQRREVRDGLGRVIRLQEPDANGSLGTVGLPAQETSYEYDVLDNLIHVNQGGPAGQHRYFKYDSLSRLTYERQVEQDAPYTTSDSVAGNSQWSRKILYNSQGLITDAYDARQINTHVSYDGLNRPLQLTYSNGSPAVDYTYDQARTGFFNQGALTTVTTAAVGQTPSTTQEFDYERLGRVAGQRQKIGAATYALSYSYNLAGLLLSERYPSGRRVNDSYDQGGRLAAVTDSAGVPYANGFTYTPHGGLSSETFGNAAVHSLSYNSRLQTSQVKLKQNASGAELQRFDYSYGQATQSSGSVDVTKNNGQIGRVDSFISGTKQWDQRFTYDSLGRLSQAAEYRGDNGQFVWQTHYDYDVYGNRFQYQQNQGLAYSTVQPSDVDASRNRFISTGATPTTYDAAGNIISDTKFRALSYVYDANNRQTSASGTGVNQTAVYDALGQRVQTSAGGEARQMVYDAFGQLVAEYGSGSLHRENMYRGGQLLASQAFTTVSEPRNVTWTNVSSTIQATGNSIQKISGTNAWDSGAVSSQMIAAGDGYMEFTPGETVTWRMCGLGNTDTGGYYADIEYAFFIDGGGGLSIYESGNLRGSFGSYAASDRLKVAVEGGVVKYYRNGSLLYTSTVAPTYPLQVDTSLNTVNSDVYNVVITSDLQNVTWTNISSTIQATGNSIQKISGTNAWDSGAVSSQTIAAGDGYMEFTPGETVTWRMCGLGNTDTGGYYADIEYAFFIDGGGGLSIYESGNLRGSFGSYAASDRLKVAVEGGVVKYYRNGTLLYTSTVAPTYPLQVDTSLNTVNSDVYNVVITSDLQNVTWTNIASTVQAAGNSVQKVSGSNNWYEAGAVSSQMIAAGDGYMEFTPGETGTWRMCGLGNNDSSVYYADIEYAFFVEGGGGLSIYESGNPRGSFGTYAAGDRLKVAVEGGVVKYYRNGTLLYTSTVAAAYPLQVDTSLNTVNSGVYNVVISGASVTASPVNYVFQDVQGSTRAVMSGTYVIARHDFLPFGEELTPGIGMRNVGQGFSLPDKIRQRYGVTERDDATGLDHTGWRKYENRSGRWTSTDPYGASMSTANPQSFNRYAYVQNDPANFVDPSGLNMQVHGFCYNEVIEVDYELEIVRTEQHCVFWGGDGGPIGGGRDPGPGGGGDLPEKPSQNVTDCEAFAAIVDGLAADTIGKAEYPDDLRNFMDAMAKKFTEYNSAGSFFRDAFANSRPGRAIGERSGGDNNPHLVFGSSGFAPDVFEPDDNGHPSNQVRHSVGGFLAGYTSPTTEGGALNRMNARENPNDRLHGVPDINLNGKTVPMGASLHGGQGRKFGLNLGNWIRQNLCAH